MVEFPFCLCPRVFTDFLVRLKTCVSLCSVVSILNQIFGVLLVSSHDTFIYSEMLPLCLLKPIMSVVSYVSLLQAHICEPFLLVSSHDTFIYSEMLPLCLLKPIMSVVSYVSLFLLVTAFMPVQRVPLSCFDARYPEILPVVAFETNTDQCRIYLTCYFQGTVTALMPRLC